MSCVPILGRLKTAAIFPLDDCMRPVYGTGVGYVDDCFAAFSTSDNMDDGESFTRRCADGTILYQEEGEQSLTSVEVNLDLNAEPAEEWMAQVGLVTPVLNGTETIGWTRCTKSSANLLVVVWQEVLGADACEEGSTAGAWRLHMFPLRKARLTLEGDIGAEDGYIRITGNTAPEVNVGRGPIPLLTGTLPADPAVFPSNDMLVCHHTALTHGVAAPPDDCGVITTQAPLAQGATAGEPGTFTPAGFRAPASLTELQNATPAIVASPTTAWTATQYVVLGDASQASWNGTAWVAFP